MIPKIIKVHYLDHYKLKIRFTDQKEGEIDLKPYLWGEMFKPLKKIDYFKKVYINPDSGTITWPNGADIAPESLYRDLMNSF